LTDEQLDQLRVKARDDLPTGKVIVKDSLFDPEVTEFFDRARTTAQYIDAGIYEPPEQELVKKKSILSGMDTMWSRAKRLVIKDSESEHAPLESGNKDLSDVAEDDSPEKIAERAWKQQNPGKTLKRQRQLYQSGVINQLPWMNSEFQEQVFKELGLQEDNTSMPAGEVKGFGSQFPKDAIKGDMYLRTDRLPTALYKFNGRNWIEVNKDLSDTYAYDNAYLDHLIAKIDSGEYDPELLSDAEKDQIAKRLTNS
jgi:hypothetical protein